MLNEINKTSKQGIINLIMKTLIQTLSQHTRLLSQYWCEVATNEQAKPSLRSGDYGFNPIHAASLLKESTN